MAIGLDLFEDVLDLAIGADDESRASNSHDLLAVHILFLQNPVGDGYLLVRIGQEGERQAFLVGEFPLRR